MNIDERQPTTDQIRRFNTLLGKLRMDTEAKRDLIHDFTAGRTAHTREMTFGEIAALCGKLQAQVNTVKDEQAEKANRMRRRIISLCHEMGMRFPGTTRINMDRVNQLVAEKGYLKDKGKKTINDYAWNELPMLVTQIERIRDHYIQKRYGESQRNF